MNRPFPASAVIGGAVKRFKAQQAHSAEHRLAAARGPALP